ncbi:SAM-dependent methyltransferase [Neobacillus piezotolerans]|uniref:SAM-dependent methyltransferase n=1 Tax=Neobacillus piezotolerans TaxID=2259171 RepID=A0A3D8GLF8_9BACI|nr:class I SAM-dependent methyltransferase [Neobacillus piezotolerans]RDU35263.1 SAM-dependent methyltransferase [Neobacillus piezotolerans]
MGKWFAALYDGGMKGLENGTFKGIRKSLLDRATGRVLEIGSGSGINFPLYSQAERIDAIEPDTYMIDRAARRISQAEVPIHVHRQFAERLEFADNTFDAAVATLVFCTIPDPEQALKEILRVSKPGAPLLFFEHVKMPQPALAKMQELLNPAWRKVCGGCNLNRNTVSKIERAGIRIEKTETYYKGLFVTIKGRNIK